MQPDTPRDIPALDHQHVWHPFTPMKQWRERDPIVIVEGDGEHLIDSNGNRYIDGTSSLWCNVHGHRVPQIDQAIRDQLNRIAHTTMLGLTNEPATQLAKRLCDITPGNLNKVFYSDSGASAVEVALKMAVGYHHHQGEPDRNIFIAISGAYHGDTVGSMSVGYSDLFHKPFEKMTFTVAFADSPDPAHCAEYATLAAQQQDTDQPRQWAAEIDELNQTVMNRAIDSLRSTLEQHTGRIAGVIIEPIVQGAAGIVVQPTGYLQQVAQLTQQHGALLIADEVATGFGRTGEMFACEHEQVAPDIMCLGKGITGGYLPLAATLATDRVEAAFCGELHEHKTLYHGHTYTGNPLGAAAALASLDLFEANGLLRATQPKAARLAELLNPLRDAERFPFVFDVRQKGLMCGIELAEPGAGGSSWLSGGTDLGDFGESAVVPAPRRLAYEVCEAAKGDGVMVRPLGNTIVVMPPLAISDEGLERLVEAVVGRIGLL